MKNAVTGFAGTLLLILGFASAAAYAVEADSLSPIVTQLRERLDLPPGTRISVVIEAGNSKLVSVRRSQQEKGLFVLSFDRHFLQTLDAEDLRAAIAHELGHIWIFTHHPFLQTEVLANREALRLVPRSSLERIYQKMFEFRGETSDLENFLGKRD